MFESLYTYNEIMSVRHSSEVLQAQVTGDPEQIKAAYELAIDRLRRNKQILDTEIAKMVKYEREHPWGDIIVSAKRLISFCVFMGVLTGISYVAVCIGIGS